MTAVDKDNVAKKCWICVDKLRHCLSRVTEMHKKPIGKVFHHKLAHYFGVSISTEIESMHDGFRIRSEKIKTGMTNVKTNFTYVAN